MTISLNERNAVINNTETIMRSTINKPHHTKIMINMIFEKYFFLVSDTVGSEEKNPSTPNRRRTYDLLVTSSDVLSYRRFVEAKTIKLGSSDKHPAYC